ncbi:MAG TPA: STAS domain-containing protein [Candidatus Omnitrophota bacterium]|nr:STAS domain-containing protein [Candidatus Omnitrophota bacterium]MDD5738178.1 STAS domain-containing protein [Candidatus Omnitrophota bacterium]HOX09917.1 STAS domain-containing protein [Candidatus Omnitrophota bacterium]HPN66246.1 STAS domain-containing protein [Candidatus Omnitrophota bacterium]HRZ67433.1 STAS domain-containing protein [Candidatus Omnitrophota bacterium]
MSLKVNSEKKPGDVFVFSLNGSIDSDTYKELDDRISPALNGGAKVIIFDMDGVEYVSSMGLNTIFKIQRTLDKSNGTFMMTNVQPQVKKVFEIVKALPSMKVFESIEEADAYLYKIQSEEKNKQNPSGF